MFYIQFLFGQKSTMCMFYILFLFGWKSAICSDIIQAQIQILNVVSHLFGWKTKKLKFSKQGCVQWLFVCLFAGSGQTPISSLLPPAVTMCGNGGTSLVAELTLCSKNDENHFKKNSFQKSETGSKSMWWKDMASHF